MGGWYQNRIIALIHIIRDPTETEANKLAAYDALPEKIFTGAEAYSKTVLHQYIHPPLLGTNINTVQSSKKLNQALVCGAALFFGTITVLSVLYLLFALLILPHLLHTAAYTDSEKGQTGLISLLTGGGNSKLATPIRNDDQTGVVIGAIVLLVAVLKAIEPTVSVARSVIKGTFAADYPPIPHAPFLLDILGGERSALVNITLDLATLLIITVYWLASNQKINLLLIFRHVTGPFILPNLLDAWYSMSTAELILITVQQFVFGCGLGAMFTLVLHYACCQIKIAKSFLDAFDSLLEEFTRVSQVALTVTVFPHIGGIGWLPVCVITSILFAYGHWANVFVVLPPEKQNPRGISVYMARMALGGIVFFCCMGFLGLPFAMGCHFAHNLCTWVC